MVFLVERGHRRGGFASCPYLTKTVFRATFYVAITSIPWYATRNNDRRRCRSLAERGVYALTITT